jgi:hypothetical protein
MRIKRYFLALTVSTVVLCSGGVAGYSEPMAHILPSGALLMQAPVVNIGTRHGNLRSAQSDIVNAYQKINRAQSANDDQLGGHAQRAKELLIQADTELRLAANVSNSEGR